LIQQSFPADAEQTPEQIDLISTRWKPAERGRAYNHVIDGCVVVQGPVETPVLAFAGAANFTVAA
jgi:hypothetical protein